MEIKDWTHKGVKITDIRKLNKLFILTIQDKEINKPILINSSIFYERLSSYFLNDNTFDRSNVLGLKWNMYITKGYFIKITNLNEIEKIEKDPDKYYVSFLEIDSGDLGTFNSILKK